jgi:hypothetical protein
MKFLRPTLVAALAVMVFLSSACSASEGRQAETRQDVINRGFTVLSAELAGMGSDIRYDVTFGDRGCTGSILYTDYPRLDMQVAVPGSATATRSVSVDNPTVEGLREIEPFRSLCFDFIPR